MTTDPRKVQVFEWLLLYADGGSHLVTARDAGAAADLRESGRLLLGIHHRNAPALGVVVEDRITAVIIAELGASPEAARRCARTIQRKA